MITLFDTHFHYDANISFQDYLDMLPSDYNFKLLAAVSGIEDTKHAQSFATFAPNVYFTAGIHPHEAESAGNLDEFEQFANDPKLKAVGEIGLDYFYGNSTKAAQLTVFEYFLQLALRWQQPAVVHLRDKDNEFSAYEDGYKLLEKFAQQGGKFVVHCFSGTPEWAEKFVKIGGYLGVTGMVTFNKAVNIRESLKHIPNDRLLLETDAPYLAPIPYRGKTNHPKYMVEIAQFVAKEKGLEFAELAGLTTANGIKLFNI